MDTKEYWKNKHSKYASQDWITKPTIFAQFAISYFPKKGKLLDLGAGQGQDSRFFSQSGYEVVSTDFSEEALKTSKETSDKENLKIEFRNVDLSKSLPFENDSFDIVYSHMAIHYFSEERTQNLFREMSDIIKPGGIIALLVNTKEDPEVKLSEEIETGLFNTPAGIVKRFFNTEDIEKLTNKYFETLILDANGETYKDDIKTLIRYIGKKI